MQVCASRARFADTRLAPWTADRPAMILRDTRGFDIHDGESTMTTATTQLTSRLRTWALVAGMTGLLIAFGALIGGSFLWLFVILAVAFNLVGYFYSDKIALKVAHARPLRRIDAPEVHEIVGELAS